MLSISDLDKIVKFLRSFGADRKRDRVELADYLEKLSADCESLVENWETEMERLRHNPADFLSPEATRFNRKSFHRLKAARARVHAAIQNEKSIADEVHERLSNVVLLREQMFRAYGSEAEDKQARINRLLDTLAQEASHLRHMSEELRLR